MRSCAMVRDVNSVNTSHKEFNTPAVNPGRVHASALDQPASTVCGSSAASRPRRWPDCPGRPWPSGSGPMRPGPSAHGLESRLIVTDRPSTLTDSAGLSCSSPCAQRQFALPHLWRLFTNVPRNSRGTCSRLVSSGVPQEDRSVTQKEATKPGLALGLPGPQEYESPLEGIRCLLCSGWHS